MSNSQTERWLIERTLSQGQRIARLEAQTENIKTFTGLTDTPSSIGSANANYFVRVDSGGSALEFGTVTYSDLPTAGAATLGVAAFDASDFSVSGGTVSFIGATATPTANAVPYADGSGKLDSWISTAGTATLGKAAFAPSTILALSGGTVTFNQGNVDHGSIGGLSDDDHTQYLRADGNRQLTGSWDAGDVSIFVKDISARGSTLPLYSDTLGMTIRSGGVVNFPQGIDFGDDTLDVFGRNTWTPAITASVSNPTVTYTTQLGDYVRIGPLVFFSLWIDINTISGGSGILRVSLPVGVGTVSGIGSVLLSGVDTPTSTVNVVFNAVTSTSFGTFVAIIDNGANTGLDVTAFAAGDRLIATGFYIAA